MDPGTYITIAQIAFQGACYAVKTFRKGLHFNQDAERLVLALEVERFRLQIWGENAGLAPQDGRPASLSGRLMAIAGILKEYLDQIEGVVNDAGGLSSRYGLLPTEQPPTKSKLVRQLVGRMQRSIKASGIRGKVQEGIEEEDDDDDDDIAEDAIESLRVRDGPSKWRKARWAVRDLDKFDGLVKDLAQRINKLNDLMTETQQQKTRQDNYRVNMVVISSAIDDASLELIRAAVRDEPDTSQVRAAVERKALSVADIVSDVEQPVSRRPAPITAPSLSLENFSLPSNYATLDRFIATKTAESREFFLFERKPYDRETLQRGMQLLTRRVNLLVNLLRRPKSDDFHTPLAEGCIKDPANSCWWIVFQYPLTLPPDIKKPKLAPLSLLTLFNTPKLRPPLEQRFALANDIAATLSELYLSGWLHKNIRSDSILFPSVLPPPQSAPTPLPLSDPRTPLTSSYTSSPQSTPTPNVSPYPPPITATILSCPLVANFSYTRHETEQITIDKARTSATAKTNLSPADDVSLRLPNIYRHPSYQGHAAQGYRLGYDIYSFGLVLVEIALWVPLGTFLDAAPARRKEGQKEDSGRPVLARDMPEFYAPHALELRRRVLGRVEGELAFRVGSAYCDAVRWCLGFADEEGEDTEGAMEFYNRVVVPLGGLV